MGLSRIVAKYPVIPYPVHRGEYRESQVAKVTKSAKKRQKAAKPGKNFQKISDLPRIIAKYPGIPYPVHRGKYREYRESQVAKVTKSAKKRQKSLKSSKNFQKTSDLPRIVAKYPGIAYPGHRGKYRESQVGKVAKSGDSAKHRYSLDGPESRKAPHFTPKPIQSAGAETEPRAKTPIQSAPRERSKNENFSETAKYWESTPASRLATRTDKKATH